MSSLSLAGDTSGNITLAAPAVAGTTAITMSAVSGIMVVLPTTVSMVRLNTANGYGSTNTVIRRFTNTVNNTGPDITYADSATLGATFTINTDGVYAISYSDGYGAQSFTGLTLNTTQPTVAINSLSSASQVLAEGFILSNNAAINISWTGRLTASDIVRAHTQGIASGSSPAGATQFTIARVA